MSTFGLAHVCLKGRSARSAPLLPAISWHAPPGLCLCHLPVRSRPASFLLQGRLAPAAGHDTPPLWPAQSRPECQSPNLSVRVDFARTSSAAFPVTPPARGEQHDSDALRVAPARTSATDFAVQPCPSTLCILWLSLILRGTTRLASRFRGQGPRCRARIQGGHATTRRCNAFSPRR